MFKKLKKYLAIFNINAKTSIYFLYDLIGRLSVTLTYIICLKYLYSSLFNLYPERFCIQTVSQIIWTWVISDSFQKVSFTDPVKIISKEIKTGSVAYTVNKPYSYILFQYFSFLGSSAPAILAKLIFIVPAVLLIIGNPELNFINIILGTILLFVGYSLNFFIKLLLAILAFWIEDVDSIEFLFNKIRFILGGALIPVSLLSEKLRIIADLSPFGAVFYNPARYLVNGNFDLFIFILSVQLFWLTICLIATFKLFNKGMNNVSISGG